MMNGGLAVAAILSLPALAQAAPAAPVAVVAAENMYGDIAAQLGGPHVHVVSIVSSPDVDPHLFETTPRVARAVAGARIAIQNGLGYDPWMSKLLAASPAARRDLLVVSDLMARPHGANPHLWYDPGTMPALVRALSARLAAADPGDAGDLAQRRDRLLASLGTIAERVASLRRRLAGIPVTASEPVFGDMAAALGLDMRNTRFQLAVMNGTEPSASDQAALESDLRQHRVRCFFFNAQASTAAAQRLRRIAQDAGIPVIGITETMPAGTDYQHWILRELDAVDQALGPAGPVQR